MWTRHWEKTGGMGERKKIKDWMDGLLAINASICSRVDSAREREGA